MQLLAIVTVAVLYIVSGIAIHKAKVMWKDRG